MCPGWIPPTSETVCTTSSAVNTTKSSRRGSGNGNGDARLVCPLQEEVVGQRGARRAWRGLEGPGRIEQRGRGSSESAGKKEHGGAGLKRTLAAPRPLVASFCRGARPSSSRSLAWNGGHRPPRDANIADTLDRADGTELDRLDERCFSLNY